MKNNELPVVGRAYMPKTKKFTVGDAEVNKLITIKNDKSEALITLDLFNDLFQELPESPKVNANLQESAQSEISEVDKALALMKEKLMIQFKSFLFDFIAVNKGAIEVKHSSVKEFEVALDHHMKILVNAIEANKVKYPNTSDTTQTRG